MRSIFKKKGTWIVIAALLVAMASVISLAAGGQSDAASRIVNSVMKPVKSVVRSMVGGLESLYGYMYEYDRVVDENNKLKAQIAMLEDEYREYSEISAENARLRALLELSERNSDHKYEEATVISWSASNWGSSFTISKGSDDGLELKDCVTTETGYIIGQITEISARSATVTTVIDPACRIGAMVYKTGNVGVASGEFEMMKENLLKFSLFADDTELISGDTIVSTGTGGIFPRGLVIGYVESVHISNTGTGSYAAIRPAADLSELIYVFIVTDFERAD